MGIAGDTPRPTIGQDRNVREIGVNYARRPGAFRPNKLRRGQGGQPSQGDDVNPEHPVHPVQDPESTFVVKTAS
jgi:hypothetical protein